MNNFLGFIFLQSTDKIINPILIIIVLLIGITIIITLHIRNKRKKEKLKKELEKISEIERQKNLKRWEEEKKKEEELIKETEEYIKQEKELQSKIDALPVQRKEESIKSLEEQIIKGEQSEFFSKDSNILLKKNEKLIFTLPPTISFYEDLHYLDMGSLTLTNKRFIFLGLENKISFNLSSIMELESNNEYLVITRTGTNKKEYYQGFNLVKLTFGINPKEGDTFQPFEMPYYFSSDKVKRFIEEVVSES